MRGWGVSPRLCLECGRYVTGSGDCYMAHSKRSGGGLADLESWYVEKSVADPLARTARSLHDKTLCVMGGCGQVGSHVLTKLYELGQAPESLCVNDNLSLGKPANLPASLRHLVDTRTHREFVAVPPSAPDVLIFVGGRSSAPHFSGLDDVLEEIECWKAVLEWCVSEGVRLIFASTSSLAKVRPSVESQRAWPGSLYELTKLMMEEMAIQQALCDGLKVQVCRFFSVYGVTEQHKGNFGNLYTQILWHAREGVPFEVWGQDGVFSPGEQTRDTIFAAEVARAVLFLLSLPAPEPSLADVSTLTYNVGQGRPVSVNEMVDQVGALVVERPGIVHAQVPAHVKNYVVHTWGDPGRLVGAGFEPLFTDHVANLRFIDRALSDMDWYWSVVDRVRARLSQ